MRAYGAVPMLVAFACVGLPAAAESFPTDAERIAALEALLEAPRHSIADIFSVMTRTAPIARMEGEVVPWDGRAIPRNTSARVKLLSPEGRMTVGGRLTFDGNAFHADFSEPGQATILLLAPGYAPAVHGPVAIHAGTITEGVRIPLEPAAPAHVRFVDESGAPVAGVTAMIEVSYAGSMFSSGSLRFESDEDGLVPVPQGSEGVSIGITALCPGYMRERRQDLVVNTNEILVWPLRADRPLHGLVVDARTGQPIAGAEVAPDFGTRSGIGHLHGDAPMKYHLPILHPLDTRTRSDRDGCFTLHELDDSQDHVFLVRAEGFGSEILRIPAGWSGEPVVEMAPRVLRGRITGALDTLRRDHIDGPPHVYAFALLPEGFAYPIHRNWRQKATVAIEGDEASFVMEDLPPGTVDLHAGAHHSTLDLVDAVTKVAIALDPLPEHPDRAFRLDLIAPEGAPPVDGSITMIVLSHRPGHPSVPEERVLRVANGHAETHVPAPSAVTLRWDGIPGYLPAPPPSPSEYDRSFRIEPDDAPYELELALERVGALRIRVRGSEAHIYGSPQVFAQNLGMRGEWPHRIIQVPHADSDAAYFSASQEVSVMPFVLDTPIQVTAQKLASPSIQVTETVTLTRENPIADVTLTLPEARWASVLVVDSNGQPVEGEQVTLLCEESRPMTSTTNDRGRVTFLVAGGKSYIARVGTQANGGPVEAAVVLSRKPELQDTLIVVDSSGP